MAAAPRCPTCNERIPIGAVSCPSCDEGGDGEEEAFERVEAGREIQRVVGALETLRWLYVVLAGLFALGTALALAIVGLLGGGPLGGVTVALLALLSIASGLGAWDVFRRPRFWTVLVALLGTPLGLASGLAIMLGRLNPMTLLWFLASAGLWYGVVLTFRMRETLRRHPDLFAARRLLGRGPRVPRSALGRKSDERDRFVAGRARRRLFVFGGGTLAAFLLVGGAWYAHLHPPVETSLADFRSSWNAGRWEAIGERFEPPARERMERGMRVLLQRRGWDEKPPPLEDPAVERPSGDRARAVFRVPDGDLRTDWDLRDGKWILTGVRFPER